MIDAHFEAQSRTWLESVPEGDPLSGLTPLQYACNLIGVLAGHILGTENYVTDEGKRQTGRAFQATAEWFRNRYDEDARRS